MVDPKMQAIIQSVVDSAAWSDDPIAVSKNAIDALADYIKQQRYIQISGEECPHCGGDMESAGPLVGGVVGIVWQECKCLECGRHIDEEYHLVGYSDILDG